MTDHCSMYSRKVHPKPSVSAHPVSCTWPTSMYFKKVHPRPNVGTHPVCCTWQTSMCSKKVHPNPNVSAHPVGVDPRSLLPWLWLHTVYSAILLACYGVICNLIRSSQIRRGGWWGFCVVSLTSELCHSPHLLVSTIAMHSPSELRTVDHYICAVLFSLNQTKSDTSGQRIALTAWEVTKIWNKNDY